MILMEKTAGLPLTPLAPFTLTTLLAPLGPVQSGLHQKGGPLLMKLLVKKFPATRTRTKPKKSKAPLPIIRQLLHLSSA